MMSNTLYLPELREMLATADQPGLREFCTALHPARTAEFMGGLTSQEAWAVLQFADVPTRTEIFHYFDPEKQIEMLTDLDRGEMGELVGQLAPDERVDILKRIAPEVVEELLPHVPAEERRDIRRLTSYPEGTAGAVMTTEFAKLGESVTVRQALDDLTRQAQDQALETIYYVYVVDDRGHLRGSVSARDLLSAVGKPNARIGDLMERNLISALVTDDQEEVARSVAKFDLLAIPVVDPEYRLVGIITHDDIIDVVQAEAIEDAHRIGAVVPLETNYLDTSLVSIAKKRGLWLTVLFFGALLTAFALDYYESAVRTWAWVTIFIPMIISTGGNTGSQSAALVITALAAGHLSVGDWLRVALREAMSGILLGGFLAILGYVIGLILLWNKPGVPSVMVSALIVPVTLLLVVLCSTLLGAMLPLLFRSLNLDPALMSTPFIAVIVDAVGIVIYVNVALLILSFAVG
jgi:magnesium transporter